MRGAFYLVILIIYFFAPKLGSLDLRLLLLPVAFLVMGASSGTMQKRVVPILGFLSVILLYNTIVGVYNGEFGSDILRYYRAFFSLVIIITLSTGGWLYSKRAEKFIQYALYIHIVSIALMALSPAVQEFLHPLYGYDKGVKAIRYTGLTAGFDISGFLCLVIAYFFYSKYKYSSNRWDLFLFFVAIVSAFFTSRGNMIYAVILMGIIWLEMIWSRKLRRKYLFAILLTAAAGILVIFRFVLPVLAASTSVEVEATGLTGVDVTGENYAVTDPWELFRSFLVFPKDEWVMIFGKGASITVDSGYIRLLWSSGLLGILLAVIFYITVLTKLKVAWRNLNILKKTPFVYGLYRLGVIIVVFSMIASVKNQYYFTRTVFEIMMFSFIYLHQYSIKWGPKIS